MASGLLLAFFLLIAQLITLKCEVPFTFVADAIAKRAGKYFNICVTAL